MRKFTKCMAFMVLIAFSNMLAVETVGQTPVPTPVPVEPAPAVKVAPIPAPAPKAEATPAKAEAKVAPIPAPAPRVEAIRTDDIVVPLRMPKAMTVEKGGVAVIAPVSVNVALPEAMPPIVIVAPPREPPVYKTWWFWTLITAVAAGAVVGGVCGSGHCGTTTNVHFGR